MRRRTVAWFSEHPRDFVEFEREVFERDMAEEEREMELREAEQERLDRYTREEAA